MDGYYNTDLQGLEKRFQYFFMGYNNESCHSSFAELTPSKLWVFYVIQKIEKIPTKNKRMKIKVKKTY